ncbi:MAG: MATE family efflux transporter [Candidatus Ornithospirochaeta sp.]
MGRNTRDMTKGPILAHIVTFALPLMAGMLFQQLYNTFDTWCVGNFVGKNSFSAVGTVGSIINMLIGFANGFSTGAGVVISQFFGAQDKKNVEKSVHTFVSFMILLSLILTVVGVAMTPLMVRLVKSPPEVAVEQRIYLTIYFSGISALLLYSMGASIFRAVGNSRLPFIFLVVSSLLNIIMDLVFVVVLKKGTAGVAVATVVAQAISTMMVLTALTRSRTQVKLDWRKLKIDWKILKRIIFIGFPSAIQLALTSFSNVFVQSYINYFGADVMGGWTAYNKVDQLLFLPMQCMGLAAMTFVGQNYGAKDIRRARKGADTALAAAFSTSVLLLIPIEIMAPHVVEFFIGKEEALVISYGTLFLRMLMPFQVFCTFNQVYANALRGIGRSKEPMFVMLFSFVLARQIYLFVMSRYISNTLIPIALGYPFGWVLCCTIITSTYVISFKKEERRLNQERSTTTGLSRVMEDGVTRES